MIEPYYDILFDQAVEKIDKVIKEAKVKGLTEVSYVVPDSLCEDLKMHFNVMKEYVCRIQHNFNLPILTLDWKNRFPNASEIRELNPNNKEEQEKKEIEQIIKEIKSLIEKSIDKYSIDYVYESSYTLSSSMIDRILDFLKRHGYEIELEEPDDYKKLNNGNLGYVYQFTISW